MAATTKRDVELSPKTRTSLLLLLLLLLLFVSAIVIVVVEVTHKENTRGSQKVPGTLSH
jgi:predicted solute-binding protein